MAERIAFLKFAHTRTSEAFARAGQQGKTGLEERGGSAIARKASWVGTKPSTPGCCPRPRHLRPKGGSGRTPRVRLERIKPPEICGKIARHLFPKDIPAIPATSTIPEQLPNCCRKVTNNGRVGPSHGRRESSLTSIQHISTSTIEAAQSSAGFDQTLSKVRLATFMPNSDPCWPTSAKLWPTSTSLVEICSILAKHLFVNFRIASLSVPFSASPRTPPGPPDSTHETIQCTHKMSAATSVKAEYIDLHARRTPRKTPNIPRLHSEHISSHRTLAIEQRFCLQCAPRSCPQDPKRAVRQVAVQRATEYGDAAKKG